VAFGAKAVDPRCPGQRAGHEHTAVAGQDAWR
jgi:hypothetical protein